MIPETNPLGPQARFRLLFEGKPLAGSLVTALAQDGGLALRARTDAQGHFSLAQVPDGKYELVCWLPNWHVARRERDPESTLTARLFFGPPVELVRRVTVRRGEKCSVAVDVSAAAFAPQP